jgi:hypothetical protein
VGRVCGTGLRGESVCGHGGANEHKVGVRPYGAMEVARRRWHAYVKSRAVALREEDGCTGAMGWREYNCKPPENTVGGRGDVQGVLCKCKSSVFYLGLLYVCVCVCVLKCTQARTQMR